MISLRHITLTICMMCTITIYPQENTNTHPIKMVVFDLEGVLVETSRAGITRHLLGRSPFSLLSQYIQGSSPREAAFAYMDQVYPHQQTEGVTYDPKGPQTPALMNDWLAGVKGCDSLTILCWLFEQLDIDTHVGRFQRHAYKSIFKAIFDPQLRTNNTYILPAGYELLKNLKAHYDDITYGILSNYDTSCFYRLYNAPHTQALFTCFDPDYICISCDMGRIKPDPQIFRDMCHKHNVQPESCLFIDDQEVNVKSAQEAGLYAVHFDIHNIDNVYRAIYTYLDT